jgi:tetratricopeptide (TPR) repeat protein
MNRKVLEDIMTRATRAFAIKDYGNAERYAQEVINKAPHAASPHILLGTIYGNQGNYDKAVASFTKARELRPRNVEALNNLGVMYRFAGDLAKAEEALKAAIKIAKRRADIYYNLGNVYKQGDKFAEALEAYEQALELDPDFVLAYNNMGTMYEQRGDLESALEVYNKGLAQDPNHPTLLYNRGVALQTLGKLDEAEKQFEKALIQRPGWVDAMNNLGVTRQKLDKLDESEEVFSQILSLDPDNPRARNNLATTYIRQGKNEEAIDLFKRALASSPEYDKAAVNLSKLLEQTTTTENAVDQIKSLYKARPTNPELAYQYAQALRKKHELAAAKQVLNPFTSSGTQTAEMDFLLGIIALMEDQEDAAEDFFIRARRKMREANQTKDGQNPVVLEAKSWIEGGFVDRGIESLDEHLRNHPKDLEVQKHLAEVLIQDERYERVVTILQNLKIDLPEDSEILAHLAKVYQHLGQKQEALETVDELINLQGQRATSDDLTSLNKSLELYEQTVAAFQEEHGDAWERSLEALAELHGTVKEEYGIGAESIDTVDDDSIPLLDFGDEQSLLDQDFLRDSEGLKDLDLLEELDDIDDMDEEDEFHGSGGGYGGDQSDDSQGLEDLAEVDDQETEALDPSDLSDQEVSHEPEVPEPSLMEMVDEPKEDLDQFEAPPVKRAQEPEPLEQRQPDPPQWPQYPPQPQPQYPPQSQYPPQPQPQYPPQSQYPPQPQPQYPPQPQWPQSPPPQYPPPEFPKEQPHTNYPKEEKKEDQIPEPEFHEEPEMDIELPTPEDLNQLDDVNQLDDPSLVPNDLMEDFQELLDEDEPGWNQEEIENFAEQEAEEELEPLAPSDFTEPDLAPDMESFDDFEPEDLEDLEHQAPEPVESEPEEDFSDLEIPEDDLPPIEDLLEDMEIPETVDLDDILEEVTPAEWDQEQETDDEGELEIEIPDDLDAPLVESLEELDLPEEPEVQAEQESRFEPEPEPEYDYEPEPEYEPVPEPEVKSRPEPEQLTDIVDDPETGQEDIEDEPHEPEPEPEEIEEPEQIETVEMPGYDLPVEPEKSVGLLDYLMNLADALPDPVEKEFKDSGAEDRMRKVRDTLAKLAEERKNQTPPKKKEPVSKVVTKPTPSAPVAHNRRADDAKTSSAENLGQAFVIMTDIAKILPGDQGTDIKRRLKTIYETMTAIRRKHGLDI